MRAKPHLSSLQLTQIFNSQFPNSQIPISIWPPKSQPNPNPSIPPILTHIHHPQILTHFLVTGLHHIPSLAGIAAKTLASSSPPMAAAFFSLLPSPDAFAANAVLRSFLSSSLPGPALSFLRLSVVPAAVAPNRYTFPLLARLFAALRMAHDGAGAHACAAKLGFARDVFVVNSLIHMYSCFGDVGAAWKVFDGGALGGSDVVTWNSMVRGLVRNGQVGAAREVFDEMGERDLVSWNVMIAGHMAVGETERAEDLFSRMPERDVVSWNSMVDGYAKAGETGPARRVFDSMPAKNAVSWNVMLAAYARVKDYRECLRLFDAMVAVRNAKPNSASFVSVLTACAGVGDLTRGKWVHYLVKSSVKDPDVLLSTSLLTMYAKCGAVDSAREVFDSMATRSIVSWNSMIVGYGLHGHGEKSIELFAEMERTGPRPNAATFMCVLSACAHGGLVAEGWRCFDRMVHVYGIKPKADHFGCMVDLLGRAGLLEDSKELASTVKGNKSLWGALMSASSVHADCRLGEVVGRKMMEMEPSDVGAHVSLSNIYAAEGRWDDVEKVREKMREIGLNKEVGVSLLGSSAH